MSGGDPPSLPQWIEADLRFAKAAEDLRMAGLAMAAEPSLIEPAAYHCQQAAEKLFKGLLVAAAAVVPRTHDLERLASLLAGRYPELTVDIENLAILSPWSVVTRYPQLESDAGITVDDVGQAIRDLGAFQGKTLALPRPAPQ
jgi:HEPN domain-containing protein